MVTYYKQMSGDIVVGFGFTNADVLPEDVIKITQEAYEALKTATAADDKARAEAAEKAADGYTVNSDGTVTKEV